MKPSAAKIQNETLRASTRAVFPASRLAIAAAFFSLAICIFLFFIYARRPDSWAALTIFPAWLWPLFALIFSRRAASTRDFRALLFASRDNKKHRPLKTRNPMRARKLSQHQRGCASTRVAHFRFRCRFFAWIFLHADFLWTKPRGELRAFHDRAVAGETGRRKTLRVVFAELRGRRRQRDARSRGAFARRGFCCRKSPPHAAVEKFTRELYGENGGLVYGLDASIVARGKIEEFAAAATKKRAHFRGGARHIFPATKTLKRRQLAFCCPPSFSWNSGMRVLAPRKTENRPRAPRNVCGDVLAAHQLFLRVLARRFLGGDFQRAAARRDFPRNCPPQFHEAFAERRARLRQHHYERNFRFYASTRSGCAA